mmetsp:Transcript_977/g.3430  ORF Transcript_977/g.3430 Transcript_977/m.3430 type:complete len:208 (+) Transcript_977:941-1564(+)
MSHTFVRLCRRLFRPSQPQQDVFSLRFGSLPEIVHLPLQLLHFGVCAAGLTSGVALHLGDVGFQFLQSIVQRHARLCDLHLRQRSHRRHGPQRRPREEVRFEFAADAHLARGPLRRRFKVRRPVARVQLLDAQDSGPPLVHNDARRRAGLGPQHLDRPAPPQVDGLRGLRRIVRLVDLLFRRVVVEFVLRAVESVDGVPCGFQSFKS